MKSKQVTDAAKAILAMRGKKPESNTTSKSRALDVDHYKDAMELAAIERGDCESKGINLLELSSIKYSPKSVAGARKGKRGYEANFANAFKGSNHNELRK